MVRMLSAMPAEQRAQFAQTLGMTAEQLEGFMQMTAQIPPAELQQMLAGMGGGAPGGPGGGADAPGTIRLTEDEMAAVNRLMALGFSQQQAAQAYLACDKNEGMAANLLFDGWGGDDGDFGGDEY
jgi:UV excision repair protein RAD23